MALPTSGPLTLAQIQTEFGGSNPISLSEYYAGGANVPAGTSGTYGAVPSSGTISIRNFYGTQKTAPTFTATISSNQDRLNLRSWALANGWNGSSPATITLASGVWIYSATTATAALTIDGSWPGGVTLINNGNIVGMGGNGGTAPTFTGNGPGAGGGTGIAVSTSVTIQNNSNVAGGGGGGGSGGTSSLGTYAYYRGGGGGGGRTGLADSAGGGGNASGGNGTSGGPGGGGAGLYNTASYYGGNGGSGGGWGASGVAGSAGFSSPTTYPGGSGGGGGLAVSGNGFITWSATGNRYGGLG
jgi:hypothetical protein